MENRCVCCGEIIPEGRSYCPGCENGTNYKCVFYDKFNLNINFIFGNNPGLNIQDSYTIKNSADIRSVLEYIHGLDEYKQLQTAGYTRTFESEFKEWKAHNVLYGLGVLPERTGSVDIYQNESKLFRFGYAILSIF